MDQSRLDEILRAGGLVLPDGASIAVDGRDPVLAARFPIAEAAAVALAACGAAAADLWARRTGVRQTARVDIRAAAASLLGFAYVRVAGEPRARINESNPTVALYQCGDGRWIHLHGGFPHLRQGTLDVLGCDNTAESIAAAVRSWDAAALEDALAARGMCGAMVRTAEEWASHAQGQALAGLPAVEVIKIGEADPEPPTSRTCVRPRSSRRPRRAGICPPSHSVRTHRSGRTISARQRPRERAPRTAASMALLISRSLSPSRLTSAASDRAEGAVVVSTADQ